MLVSLESGGLFAGQFRSKHQHLECAFPLSGPSASRYKVLAAVALAVGGLEPRMSDGAGHPVPWETRQPVRKVQ